MNDILIRETATNRSNQAARLDVLPTLWFRNTWAWDLDVRRPRLERGASMSGAEVIEVNHFDPSPLAQQNDGKHRLPELISVLRYSFGQSHSRRRLIRRDGRHVRK